MKKALTPSQHFSNKGKMFGKLKITGTITFPDRGGVEIMHYFCTCECGTKKIIKAISVTSGVTVSCGCHKRNFFNKLINSPDNPAYRHGMSKTREYIAYVEAKKRCNNKNVKCYGYYGGRGIMFLFESFEEFYEELGDKPTLKHQLDRKNTNGHYEKGNVRWATTKENTNNRRNSIKFRKIH